MPPAARTTSGAAAGSPVLIDADDIRGGAGVDGASSVSAVTGADKTRSDVEVEWQLDAIDLRPVERWFSARNARPGRRRPDPAARIGARARGGGAGRSNGWSTRTSIRPTGASAGQGTC